MIEDKTIKKINQEFNASSDIVYFNYNNKHNKTIKLNIKLKEEMIKLFDCNKINRSKLIEAFSTILCWYNFYNKRFDDFPKTQIIFKEIEEIENSIDNLLNKLNNLSAFSKYTLNTYTYKNDSIFNSRWFKPTHKIHRADYRIWSGRFISRRRQFIKLNICQNNREYFADKFEVPWYLKFLVDKILTKRMQQAQISGHSLIDKELIDHLALISSWANNRLSRFKKERIQLLNGEKPSEHSMAKFIWPSPFVFLMRECGLLLAANGCNIDNHDKLAKLIHAQSVNKNYSAVNNSLSRWGEGYQKEVGDWLKQVQPYIGKFTKKGPTGERIECVFPSLDQFPTPFTPTLSHCLLTVVDDDGVGDQVVHAKRKSAPPLPAELWNGPGWEKAAIAQI